MESSTGGTIVIPPTYDILGNKEAGKMLGSAGMEEGGELLLQLRTHC